MNFHEAVEIAKKHPGSILTRNDSGDFIVRYADGSDVYKNLINERSSLQIELTTLREKCDNLKSIIENKNLELKQQRLEINQLREQIKSLTSELSKVSQTEWNRIEEVEKLEKRELKEKNQKIERDRIMNLVHNHLLSHDRLQLVLDNSSKLGLSKDERDIINKQLEKMKSITNGLSLNSFVIYSNTDGQ